MSRPLRARPSGPLVLFGLHQARAWRRCGANRRGRDRGRGRARGRERRVFDGAVVDRFPPPVPHFRGWETGSSRASSRVRSALPFCARMRGGCGARSASATVRILSMFATAPPDTFPAQRMETPHQARPSKPVATDFSRRSAAPRTRLLCGGRERRCHAMILRRLARCSTHDAPPCLADAGILRCKVRPRPTSLGSPPTSRTIAATATLQTSPGAAGKNFQRSFCRADKRMRHTPDSRDCSGAEQIHQRNAVRSGIGS